MSANEGLVAPVISLGSLFFSCGSQLGSYPMGLFLIFHDKLRNEEGRGGDETKGTGAERGQASLDHPALP